MDTDLAVQALAMKQAQTQQVAQYAILRKQHEMQTDLIAMLSEAVKSAPPPGQGLSVDKIA